MDFMYLSPIINILLVIAFIIDRVFRLKSIKEYKDAKEAQIELLKQQLDLERQNNDIEITEMHKRRYESLKIILDEKEDALNINQKSILYLQTALEKANKQSDLKQQMAETLMSELNRIEKSKHDLEIEKRAFEEKLKSIEVMDLRQYLERPYINGKEANKYIF